MRTPTASSTLLLTSLLLLFFTGCQTNPYQPKPPSEKAYQLNHKSRAALDDLYAISLPASHLAKNAEAILVFPAILKGGFIFGGQGGRGTLYGRDDQVIGHYQSVAASWGLLAGVHKYGYALFFMDRAALAQLDKTGGWEFGTQPNITFVDAGAARTISTTTASRGIIAFAFNQAGLMGSLSLEGSKITQVYP